MRERLLATITSEGQITLPTELLEAWGLKPGDQVAFGDVGEHSSIVEPRRKRSILDRLDELKLPDIGRPFTQADIDESVAQAMAERVRRSRSGA
ncbi:MAG: AbrB/MazE/SpoVT family DNA-binding domain-containing protein [Roseiarcus sp.]